ncbi:MAG: hypothetical protein ISR52_10070, partial [Rhodospirillales bacterium]|nr:hypothetical protein [Rhodospirillales bacterium]
NNALLGGSGDDVLFANGDSNRLFGDYDTVGGDDTIYATGNNNTLLGEIGNDVLVSAGHGNVLDGGSGDDILLGGTGSETYVFNLGNGSDAIADLGGTDILEIHGDIANWADLDITATKGDDGSFLNLMFSEGTTQWGDVTLDLANGQLLETLRLGDGAEMNFQDIYDGALEIPTADLDSLSASLEAVLDGADGLSETGEIADMVFTESGDGINEIIPDDDPLA